MPYTQEQEPKPKCPAPEGRLEVEAVVLGIKSVPNNYSGGVTWKMLVRLEESYCKAWVSIPAGTRVERGEKIAFKATFKRSDSDPYFAFASRPVMLTDTEPSLPSPSSDDSPSPDNDEEEAF